MPRTKIARSVKAAGDLVKHGRAEREQQSLVKVILEAENWSLALKLYRGNPIDALLLAQQLMAIRQCLRRGGGTAYRTPSPG